MRKFSFRLQSALDHARHEEDEAAQKLAALEAERREQERRLEEMTAFCESLATELNRAQTGELAVAELRARRAHLEDVRNRCAELQDSLRAQGAAISEQRDRVVAYMKRRQVLERLRDMKQAEHQQEMLWLELGQQDELSTAKFSRRQSEGGE